VTGEEEEEEEDGVLCYENLIEPTSLDREK